MVRQSTIKTPIAKPTPEMISCMSNLSMLAFAVVIWFGRGGGIMKRTAPVFSVNGYTFLNTIYYFMRGRGIGDKTFILPMLGDTILKCIRSY
jgi:hypothetical protein